MVLVDSERRYVDANVASRLLLRRSLRELRGLCADDLTPRNLLGDLEETWDRLMCDGLVAGERLLSMPDGPEMTIAYCAAANMLPGGHLLVFAPASWPEEELGGLIDERPPSPSGKLTARERDVLAQIAAGADIRGIAAELSLSPNTVKTHLRNAMRRIGARNRAHAIALALRSGEIT